MDRRSAARRRVAACLYFALLPALFFPGVWLRGEVPFNAAVLLQHLPWRRLQPEEARPGGNPVLDDPVHQFLPWEFTARRWARGLVPPLWNPDAGLGAPFLANPQAALLDPLRLAGLPFPPATAWTLRLWLRLALAGLLAYGLARHLGLAPRAGLFLGTGFALGGFMVPWLSHPHAGAALYLPALLWAGAAWLRGGGRRAWLGLVAVWAAQLLAGHPETSAHLLLLALPFWLVGRGGGRRWLGLAAGLLCGTLLVAPGLLAAADYVRRSVAYAHRTGAPPPPVPLRAALTFFLPRLFGWPLRGGDWHLPLNANETVAYVGLTPWLLLPWARRRARLAAAAAALLLVGAAGAYGLLPPVGGMNHRRLLLGVGFGVLLLGALGLDGLDRRRRRPEGVWLLGGGLLASALLLPGVGAWTAVRRAGASGLWALALVAAAGLLLRAGRPVFFVPLALADLLLCWWGYQPTAPRRQFYPPTPALSFLAQHVRPGDRVLPLPVAGRAALFPPNTLEAYGLAHPDNYDALGLPGPTALWRRATGLSPAARREDPRVRLLGARWWVAPLPLERVAAAARLLPGRSHTVLCPQGEVALPVRAVVVESYLVGSAPPRGTVAARLTVRARRPDGHVTDRTFLLRCGEATAPGAWAADPSRGAELPPRARVFTVRDARGRPYPRFVYRARIPWRPAWGIPLGARVACTAPAGVLELEGVGWIGADGRSTLSPRVEPLWRGELYVYEDRRALPRAFLTPGDDLAVLGALRAVRCRRLDGRTLVVTGEARPGERLVVLEGFDPGWRAVDGAGRSLPVTPAFGALLGVRPPPGPFRLTFRYRPWGWPWSLLGPAAAGASFLFVARRRRGLQREARAGRW